MNNLLYQYHALQNEMEMEVIAGEESALIVATAVRVRTELTRQERINRRQLRRQYLCRAQLLPNPRMSTPWKALFASQNDQTFVTTMGFDVETFHLRHRETSVSHTHSS
jgi:hypothetical protein